MEKYLHLPTLSFSLFKVALNGFITKAIWLLPFGIEFGMNLPFIFACCFTFILMEILKGLDKTFLKEDSFFETIEKAILASK